MLKKYTSIFMVIMILFVFSVQEAHAFKDDDATFESFYTDNSMPTWVKVTLYVGLAATSFFIIGPAVVPAIGGIIGSAGTGLAGAAAVNHGLALVGLGSVASGGFGIAGGTFVLKGVIGKGLEDGTDYVSGKIAEYYNESQLREQIKQFIIEQSRNFINLPPFKGAKGNEAVEKASEYFKENYHDDELPSSEHNRQVCSYIINNILDRYIPSEKGFWYTINPFADEEDLARRHEKERIRFFTARSIVNFMLNDYDSAMSDAKTVISIKDNYESATIPHFIYSVSLLIKAEDIDQVNKSLINFQAAMAYEKMQTLYPVLLAIYLSRLDLTGNFSPDTLSKVKDTVSLLATMDIDMECEKSLYNILGDSYIAALTKYNEILDSLFDNVEDVDFSNPNINGKMFIKNARSVYKSYSEIFSQMKDFIHKVSDTRNYYRLLYRVGKSEEDLKLYEKTIYKKESEIPADMADTFGFINN